VGLSGGENSLLMHSFWHDSNIDVKTFQKK